ncbi:TetR/AcrR family transcriptional regulator [Bifidobacterium sp. MA2]|uniref:TetR/AcrR family transcriptional regulator n=1 Tax=Bifidobacterium santillanense TaxID=2809028 RepID=A0ABS5URG4_9BIFI|nr:TetR/AcrR family transcriptional regulator [Bifidobacterium santillanense]MBT1173492.1 TetR/AcrR family transcriptional regulator [Bifidobacterium santillanense]
MARGKNPERTRARILDAAKRLFLTKGYDGTTMQDIVDGLGDLSKGAVYYHFRSKEAILDALGDEDHERQSPAAILDDPTLTGLEKIRTTFRANADDLEHMQLMGIAYPTLRDPKLLAANLDAWRTTVADMFHTLILQGIDDGSIATSYPREAAELLALLTNYWLVPTFYPATEDELRHRVSCLASICAGLGVPVFDDDLIDRVARAYATLGADDGNTADTAERKEPR